LEAPRRLGFDLKIGDAARLRDAHDRISAEQFTRAFLQHRFAVTHRAHPVNASGKVSRWRSDLKTTIDHSDRLGSFDPAFLLERDGGVFDCVSSDDVRWPEVL
jgi:hypothetical protein